jgi:hypothetical protein
MRPFVLVSVLVATTHPVLAQPPAAQRPTRVAGSVLQADSVHWILFAPTPEAARKLSLQLTELRGQVSRVEEQIVSATRSQGNADAVNAWNSRMRSLLFDMNAAESQLRLVCAALQRRPAPDGVLGITVDASSMARIQAGIERPVQRFVNAPRVDSVVPGSPAAEVVQVGDVWLAVQGRPLAGASVEEIDSYIKPGARLRISLQRDGRTVDAAVTVAKRDIELVLPDACRSHLSTTAPIRLGGAVVRTSPRGGAGTITAIEQPASPASSFSAMGAAPKALFTIVQIGGATFRTLDKDARDFVDVQGDGVLVTDVLPGSPAERSGLRGYDVVIRANGEQVATPRDVSKFLLTSSNGPLVLTVIRKGETRVVSMPR